MPHFGPLWYRFIETAHGPETGTGGGAAKPWTLRLAGSGESDAVAMLHTESWKAAYREHLAPSATLDKAALRERKSHWRRIFARLGEHDFVLLAEARDTLLGFGAVTGPSDEGCDAVLEGIYIHPGHRSRGLGTILLGAIAERLIAGARTSLCIRLLEGDERGQRFYMRLGGKAAGQSETLVSGEAVPQMVIVWSDLGALSARCRGLA